MALAIDASTPAIVTQTVSTTSTVTTASFTPPSTSLLLIRWVGNSNGGVSPAAPTITDSLGAPLTYTLLDWQSRADSPTRDGQAACWWAKVTTSAAMTVTVTTAAPNGFKHAALHVTVLTGHDTTTPIGAHGKSGSVSTASIAQSYTAQATGGQGFIVVCDWDDTGAETPGAGCTLTNGGSASITGQISYGFLRRTSADDSNGASNTLNVTLPATSTNVSWTYAEVRPAAAAGTASFPPYWEGRRRLLAAPRLPRARMSTPVRAQVNPPMPFVDPNQARRVRGLAPRRGRSAQPGPPQIVVVPPAFVARGLRARIRSLRLPRARTVQVVPPQITVLPPSYVPRPARSRVKGLRLARGRVTPAPTPQVWVAVKARQSTLRQAPVRRRAVAFPAPQQAAPPLFRRIKLRVLRLLRSASRPVVPAQVILIAPPYPPQPTRARRAAFAARRRRAAVDAWMVPDVVSCQLPRPNTGSIARPGAGSTVRPTATTLRPGSGVTARPDSGTTENPC